MPVYLRCAIRVVHPEPSHKLSFFGNNQNDELLESARVEHSQDSRGIGTVTTRVRCTNSNLDINMVKTMEFSPESSTFTSTDSSSQSNSVIFSSKGVSVMTEDSEGLYFGAGKDFRIAILDGILVVQAYSEQTADFVTKMEIGSKNIEPSIIYSSLQLGLGSSLLMFNLLAQQSLRGNSHRN